jgi:hypothetical protein
MQKAIVSHGEQEINEMLRRRIPIMRTLFYRCRAVRGAVPMSMERKKC